MPIRTTSGRKKVKSCNCGHLVAIDVSKDPSNISNEEVCPSCGESLYKSLPDDDKKPWE